MCIRDSNQAEAAYIAVQMGLVRGSGKPGEPA